MSQRRIAVRATMFWSVLRWYNRVLTSSVFLGHFYCHECLIRSLMAAEKSSDRGIGNCPICRKSVSRSARSKHNIIPIAFMKKEAFELNRLKRRVAQESERQAPRHGR